MAGTAAVLAPRGRTVDRKGGKDKRSVVSGASVSNGSITRTGDPELGLCAGGACMRTLVLARMCDLLGSGREPL